MVFPYQLKRLVQQALDEDMGTAGDITTQCTVPEGVVGRGSICARETVVVSGLDIAKAVFCEVDSHTQVCLEAKNGDTVQAGQALLTVEGSLAAILIAERPALNFLMHLCGIATHTRRFVDELSGCSSKLTATRKTTPGIRALEKAAVAHGGAHNHRFGLFDGILIKDNHIVACGGIVEAVESALAKRPHHLVKIGVEVDLIEQIEPAIKAGAEHLLLDNMPPDVLRVAVNLVAGRVSTEASGGVNLKSIRSIAETGVDHISCGGLIHQSRWVDLGMDFQAL